LPSKKSTINKRVAGFCYHGIVRRPGINGSKTCSVLKYSGTKNPLVFEGLKMKTILLWSRYAPALSLKIRIGFSQQ